MDSKFIDALGCVMKNQVLTDQEKSILAHIKSAGPKYFPESVKFLKENVLFKAEL